MFDKENQKKIYEENIKFLKTYLYITKRTYPEFDEMHSQINWIENKRYEIITDSEFCDKFDVDFENINCLNIISKIKHDYWIFNSFDVFKYYLRVHNLAHEIKEKRVVILFSDDEIPYDFKGIYGLDLINMNNKTIDLIEMFNKTLLRNDLEMIKYEAYEMFEREQFDYSFVIYAALYNLNQDFELFDSLRKVFFEPNRMMMNSKMRKNVKLIKTLDNSNLTTKFKKYVFPISDEHYVIFNELTNQFEEIIGVNNQVNQPYLMDIEDVCVLIDEYDFKKLEYLAANLMKSNQIGKDNNLYLYYTSIELFLIYMQIYDIEKLLSHENVEFFFDYNQLTIAKENAHFELIDEVIHANDINRLIVGLPTYGLCGSMFLDNILDYHPELLTIGVFGLNGFGVIYENVLKQKTIEEVVFLLERIEETNLDEGIKFEFYKIFKDYELLNKPIGFEKLLMNQYFPKRTVFLKYLKKCLKNIEYPTAKQWLNAFFLAYSYALGRTFKGRKKPSIFIHIHDGLFFNNEMLLSSFKVVAKEYDFVRGISIIRNPITMFGSTIKTYPENNQIDVLKMILNSRCLYDNKELVFSDRALVRFEDLKINSKATFMSICQFLDLKYSDSMFRISSNGVEYTYSIGKTITKGFDKRPVYKSYKKYFNVFDKYRLELIFDKYYFPYAYNPHYYDGAEYKVEDLKKMLEVPFEFEKHTGFMLSMEEKNMARFAFIEAGMCLVTEFSSKNVYEPIRWLYPMKEYLDNDIYKGEFV